MPKPKSNIETDRIVIYLPVDLKDRVTYEAYQAGMPVSTWVTQLLEKEILQLDQDKSKG